MIRIVDFFLAALLLPIVAVICVPLAALKLCVDGRPLFYVSKRVGLGGRLISTYKFRTMVRDREFITAEVAKHRGSGFEVIPISSPVYTRLGRVFERYQLVELPQFFNVLKGDLSLVGHRPLPQSNVDDLSKKFGAQALAMRHVARPGITGFPQLMGKGNFTDERRLEIEIGFSQFITSRAMYATKLAIYFFLLFSTVTVVLTRKSFFIDRVHNYMKMLSTWSQFQVKAKSDHVVAKAGGGEALSLPGKKAGASSPDGEPLTAGLALGRSTEKRPDGEDTSPMSSKGRRNEPGRAPSNRYG